MNLKSIPCIESKCLMYPMCLNKKDINCDHIKEYLRMVTRFKGNRKEAYKSISAVLPRTRTVRLKDIESKGKTTIRFRYIRRYK